jgi:hypothetical protein
MRWILIFCILLAPCGAVAQEEGPFLIPPPPHTLPTGTNDADGNKILTPLEWQQVMLLANAYLGLYKWRIQIEPAVYKYQAMERDYELKVLNLKGQLGALERHNKFLDLRLAQSENDRIKFHKHHQIEKGVMWGVIVIEAIIIAVLGFGVMTN